MRLSELRSGMEALVASFQPETLSGAVASAMLDDASAISHMAATLTARLARRIEDCGTYRRAGDRSAAEHVARRTGSTPGRVADAMRTAERLEALPGVDAAVRRGELSPQQASVIADAASTAPEAEGQLLDAARTSNLRELEASCARVKAAHTDLEARRRKIHAGRFLRSWTDSDGAGHIHAKGTPEDVALIMGGIDAERDAIFKQARREGRIESPDAYAFDALKNLCTGEKTSKGAASTRVIVRVDFDALLRGYPIDGEMCEVAGCPVAVSAVEELLRSGSAFLAGVITKGKKLVGAVHFGRAPTELQQTGLEWLYPTCAVAGCSAAARLQRDHREDWAKTHVTIFDLLDLLCPFHHGLKTRDNWALVEGTGTRDFVPPDDPRHPRHARHSADPPTAA